MGRDATFLFWYRIFSNVIQGSCETDVRQRKLLISEMLMEPISR
jgi:hypothetical protein